MLTSVHQTLEWHCNYPKLFSVISSDRDYIIIILDIRGRHFTGGEPISSDEKPLLERHDEEISWKISWCSTTSRVCNRSV